MPKAKIAKPTMLFMPKGSLRGTGMPLGIHPEISGVDRSFYSGGMKTFSLPTTHVADGEFGTAPVHALHYPIARLEIHRR
jgi:hypothetical protein